MNDIKGVYQKRVKLPERVMARDAIAKASRKEKGKERRVKVKVKMLDDADDEKKKRQE